MDQPEGMSYEQEDGQDEDEDDESITNPFMVNKEEKKARIAKKGQALIQAHEKDI